MRKIWFVRLGCSLIVGLGCVGLSLQAADDKLAASGAGGIPKAGLVLDLDADHGVEITDGRVTDWVNQADFPARHFKATRATGRPSLRKSVSSLGGHASMVFEKQELINDDEDAFDTLTTGSGYTWAAVLTPYQQVEMEKDVDCFFGNLKNGGNFEGLWGGLNDDNTVWCGSRNGITFGRWDDNNPKVVGPRLQESHHYLLAGRMSAGTATATVELFVNEPKPVGSKPFPVNPKANASKMAIGQERDAQNHPGRESFKGELARIVVWSRPLSDAELTAALTSLRTTYHLE